MEKSNECSGEEGGSPDRSSGKKEEEEEEEEEEELCGVVSVINLTHHRVSASLSFSLSSPLPSLCQTL